MIQMQGYCCETLLEQRNPQQLKSRTTLPKGFNISDIFAVNIAKNGNTMRKAYFDNSYKCD